jgi:hypothetical protein
MPKPSINADLDVLRGEVSHGAVGSTTRNIGGGMGGKGTPGSGTTGGIRGIPSRTGGPPRGQGTYQGITGSPGPASPVTPGSVPPAALGGASQMRNTILSHGRTLGAVAHIRSVHGDHPHLQAAHAKATAGLAKASKMKNQAPQKGPSFGSLGGGSTMIPNTAGQVGGSPLGAASLPDEV